MADRLSVSRELVAHLIRRLRARVEYADVRCEHLLHESLVAEGGRVASISLFESAGIGLRVLVNGSWGFASTPHLTNAAVERAAVQAIGLAKASSALNRQPRPLTPVEPATARYRSPYQVDPFDIPLSQKLDYLLWANTALLGPEAVKRATSHMDFYKRRKLFCSTEGADRKSV